MEGILIEQALHDIKQMQWCEITASRTLGIGRKESIALEALSQALKKLYREQRDKWEKLKQEVIEWQEKGSQERNGAKSDHLVQGSESSG